VTEITASLVIIAPTV